MGFMNVLQHAQELIHRAVAHHCLQCLQVLGVFNVLKERQHLLALIRVWGLFAALYGRGAFEGSHSPLFGFVG